MSFLERLLNAKVHLVVTKSVILVDNYFYYDEERQLKSGEGVFIPPTIHVKYRKYVAKNFIKTNENFSLYSLNINNPKTRLRKLSLLF